MFHTVKNFGPSRVKRQNLLKVSTGNNINENKTYTPKADRRK